MATRTNIVLKNGSSLVYLYRHWDGYPGDTGADLALRAHAAHGDAGKFLLSLLAATRGGEGYDKDRPLYELTTEQHGDINWLYEFEYGYVDKALADGLVIFEKAGDQLIEVKVSSRNFREADGAWVQKAQGKGTDALANLVYLVNKDRIEMNKRLLELQAKNPGNPHYSDAEMYPMLTWPAAEQVAAQAGA